MADQIPRDIQAMLDNPGMYLCGDEKDEEATIPIVSMNGCLYSVKFDTELDPMGWLESRTITGPYHRSTDDEIEQYQAALYRIVQWADAYPLTVFPEPDFKKAEEVLKAAGLSLTAISASNMRHVVEGVRKIASEGLIRE